MKPLALCVLATLLGCGGEVEIDVSSDDPLPPSDLAYPAEEAADDPGVAPAPDDRPTPEEPGPDVEGADDEEAAQAPDPLPEIPAFDLAGGGLAAGGLPDAPGGPNDGECSLGSFPCPARTCLSIREMRRRAPSGAYWLDTDGEGPLSPLRVWCDLETDGGGWSLLATYMRNAYDAHGFRVTEARRMTIHGGGPATDDWFPMPNDTYGHLSYERFPPAGREVAFECGTERRPGLHRYVTEGLFDSWAPGIRGRYGAVGEPG